jgi:hypothetical protein
MQLVPTKLNSIYGDSDGVVGLNAREWEHGL